MRVERHLPVLARLDVLKLSKNVGHPVEDLRHGTRAVLDLTAQLICLALEAPPAFGPTSMRLAFGARVTVMLAHLIAQGAELSLAPLAFAPVTRIAAWLRLFLKVVEFPADARVLGEIAQVAFHRLCIAVERVFLRTDLACEVDDSTVCLELREARLQNFTSVFSAKQFDEVDGHVVGRFET